MAKTCIHKPAESVHDHLAVDRVCALPVEISLVMEAGLANLKMRTIHHAHNLRQLRHPFDFVDAALSHLTHRKLY